MDRAFHRARHEFTCFLRSEAPMPSQMPRLVSIGAEVIFDRETPTVRFVACFHSLNSLAWHETVDRGFTFRPQYYLDLYEACCVQYRHESMIIAPPPTSDRLYYYDDVRGARSAVVGRGATGKPRNPGDRSAALKWR